MGQDETSENLKYDVFTMTFTTDDDIMSYTPGRSISNGEERLITYASLNPKSNDFDANFDFLLKLDNSLKSRTIGIDYRLLNNKTVDLLKEAYLEGRINGIRILPDDTVLSKDICDLFRDDDFKGFLICVDKTSEKINLEEQPTDIRVQSNLCKIEHVVYGKDGEQVDNYNIHITKKLDDEEINRLVKLIEKGTYQNIYVDFYDPAYYEDLLRGLNNNKISDTIKINLLGNPLYDEETCYHELNSYLSNPIEVNYNTSVELNDDYTDEPFSEGAKYYSDIEVSGVDDVSNYGKTLKLVDELVNHINQNGYSPLEAVVYLLEYFKDNVKADEVVSNLYSTVLRRVGVPCFKYTSDNHQNNIIRIKDDKYDIDNLAIIDVKKDIDVENNHNVFQNFLVPLSNDLYSKEPENINIPTSLVMNTSDYYTFIGKSNSGYETDPLGDGVRMLQLMGLGTGERTFLTEIEEREFYKTALFNSTMLEKIPSRKIAHAVEEVRMRENKYVDGDVQEQEEISNALQIRGNEFYVAPAIKLKDENNAVVDVDLYRVDVNDDIKFTNNDVEIDLYKRPRKKMDDESLEDYKNYLKDFYHKYFYLKEYDSLIEENSKGDNDMPENNEEIEEYEIDDVTVKEIVLYRDVNDSGRVFANKGVFARFHLDPPASYITVDNGEVVYELATGNVTDILGNANNNYSPYVVRFVYIELNENDISLTEDEEETLEDLIPETEFKKPRAKEEGESDKDYLNYLRNYYANLYQNKETTKEVSYEEINKPRPRALEETEEGYLNYLKNYYANQNNEEKAVEEEKLANDNNITKDDDYIPGTNYKKPRPRADYETNDDYVSYLEDYYDSIFGDKDEDKPMFDLVNDNLIPGTNYEKPRVRGQYETDEEYVAYLEDYYKSIFGTEEEEKGKTR